VKRPCYLTMLKHIDRHRNKNAARSFDPEGSLTVFFKLLLPNDALDKTSADTAVLDTFLHLIQERSCGQSRCGVSDKQCVDCSTMFRYLFHTYFIHNTRW
jgi:hypothetical protein